MIKYAILQVLYEVRNALHKRKKNNAFFREACDRLHLLLFQKCLLFDFYQHRITAKILSGISEPKNEYET